MGRFVVIEGPDGVGKTTVINGIKERLPKDLKSKFIREPGGSPLGEKIREILLNKALNVSPETEALLFAAMRSENYAILKKDLPNYDIIISDRFLPSSLAYQGAGLALGMENIEDINDFFLHGYRPDLTIYLMLNKNTGMERIKKVRDYDKFELRDNSFFSAVNMAYEKLSNYPNSVVIDASMSEEEVLDTVMKEINKLL
ncbi:MAG: dTMP kinase [Ezakiella sp.]|nr:dTMP kinase [Ezakiella sp.]MDD7472478.1 dTMP kinase [Bacillota bacterium]MDY3923279.1 dTMP kinase [Ezakiella sp.]